eukprot:CAMPEP_0117758184 /NCGR_PEP_ID=MMETSP0947-20121206/15216_1 /TAXON_ID=44440 /ORGANISM="Chattonella subsalsa, Strain CCMP2191" /LENGTH=293 /DNA_ID=CAMNT_0005578301 /DNA_START=201 /DNA_END=1082 /DNA_ORIENTATION=-
MAHQAAEKERIKFEAFEHFKFKMLIAKAVHKKFADMVFSYQQHRAAMIIQQNFRVHSKFKHDWAKAVIQYRVFQAFKPRLKESRRQEEEKRSNQELMSFQRALDKVESYLERYVNTEAGTNNYQLYEKEYIERGQFSPESKKNKSAIFTSKKKRALQSLKRHLIHEFQYTAKRNFRHSQPPRYSCVKCSKVFLFEREMLVHTQQKLCHDELPSYGPIESALLANVLEITFKNLRLDFGQGNSRHNLLLSGSSRQLSIQSPSKPSPSKQSQRNLLKKGSSRLKGSFSMKKSDKV